MGTDYNRVVGVAKKRGNAVGVSWRGQTIKAPRQSPHRFHLHNRGSRLRPPPTCDAAGRSLSPLVVYVGDVGIRAGELVVWITGSMSGLSMAWNTAYNRRGSAPRSEQPAND